jgi:Transglutaminase-like superfamily
MPGRIARLIKLPLSEKFRMLLTWVLLVLFRIGLWTIPYRVLKRFADATAKGRDAKPDDIQSIVRCVTSMARFVYEGTCLTQALTTQVLMKRVGLIPTLRLGVAQENGQFKAHAWIEYDGKVIIGDLGPKMVFTTLRQAPAADSTPAGKAA